MTDSCCEFFTDIPAVIFIFLIFFGIFIIFHIHVYTDYKLYIYFIFFIFFFILEIIIIIVDLMDVRILNEHLFSKGLFTWRWGTPGRRGAPLRWGKTITLLYERLVLCIVFSCGPLLFILGGRIWPIIKGEMF